MSFLSETRGTRNQSAAPPAVRRCLPFTQFTQDGKHSHANETFGPPGEFNTLTKSVTFRETLNLHVWCLVVVLIWSDAQKEAFQCLLHPTLGW